MTTTTRILKTRVPLEAADIVASLARGQQLTTSAWLRRLITNTLHSTGVIASELTVSASDELPRAARLMIRLLRDDQLLLQARARARAIPVSTYAAIVLRVHLRGVVPLPKEEMQGLKRAIGELGAIGRNLNQIARAANQGGRVSGPSREDLRALLRACEGLRDHIRRLIEANLRSWESGNAEAPR